MQLQELTREDHRRFVQRTTRSEAVWGIRLSNGLAFAYSNEDPGDGADPVPVLLFWSDRAYAARAQDQSFPDGIVESIALFDFLYRWLPGMAGDGILVGTNWTGDLIGTEVDPGELQERLLEALDETRKSHYRARLHADRNAGQA